MILLLFFLFVGLKLIDYGLTEIGLEMGLEEMNPLVSDEVGRALWCAAVIGFTTVLVRQTIDSHPIVATVVLGAGIIVYGAVDLRNLDIIRKKRGGK